MDVLEYVVANERHITYGEDHWFLSLTVIAISSNVNNTRIKCVADRVMQTKYFIIAGTSICNMIGFIN